MHVNRNERNKTVHNLVSSQTNYSYDKNDILQTGMIRLSHDTIYVQPIPDHLAKHVTTGNGAKLHLVYRKSTDVNDCQSKAGIANLLDEGQLVTPPPPPPHLPMFF